MKRIISPDLADCESKPSNREFQTITIWDGPTKAENDTHFTEGTLWKAFLPLFYSMTAFGLYFPPKVCHIGCQTYKRQVRCMRPHSLIAITLLVVNAVRFLFVYNPNDSYSALLFSKIVKNIWFIQVLFQCVACYHAFSVKEMAASLFRHWSLVVEHELLNSVTLKRKVIAGTVLCWVVAICNICTNIDYVYFQEYSDILAPHPYYVTFNDGGLQALKVMIMIVIWYCSGSWIFPTAFVIFICTAISNAFRSFNQDLKEEITTSSNLKGKIGFLRKRHQTICEMTGIADEVCKILVAVIMSAASLHVILIMFILVTEKGLPITMILIYLFWLSVEVGSLLALCVSAGILNHEAHDSKKLLYSVDISTDCEESKELTIFLSRVEGSSIGLSVLDMFVIDKPAILSVFAGLISYFTLLLTFQSSASNNAAAPISVNCTALFHSLFNSSQAPLQG